MVCGHTHMPFVRLAPRRLVVDPGSVIMPHRRAGAHWALLRDGAVQLRRTDFEVDAAVAAITADSRYPGAAAFADYFVRSGASDSDALTAFSPRHGRD